MGNVRNALLAVAVVAALVPTPPALAEERTCRGTLGAITVDNLRVPDGATCSLEGTLVKGTVKVETRATLAATNIRVIGNVQAESARRVVVRGGSRVGGSVQVGAGRGRPGRRFIDQWRHPVRRAAPSARGLAEHGWRQPASVPKHGWAEIRRNRIDGNLQCKENDPAPSGGNNRVDGNKEDQCEGL